MNKLILNAVSCGLLASGAYAQTLSYSIQDIVVEPGELITLTVNVDGGLADMRGFTLDLLYENSMVDIYSINQGSLLLEHSPSFLYWNDELINGVTLVRVDYAILGGISGVQGPGDLLHITFEAVGCGIETLAIVAAEFRDLDNQSIAVDLGTGIEHQVCQAPPLRIVHQLNGDKLLSWGRVLNANFFTVYRSVELAGPWIPVQTTTDTTWVDASVAAWPQALYRLRVDHP